MDPKRAAVIGFALIGTFAFLNGLGDAASRLSLLLHLRNMLAAATKFGSGEPPVLEGITVPLSVTVLFNVLPGFFVIVARHRLAAWLVSSASETVELGVSAEIFRLGFVLLGTYLVITGISSVPSMLSVDFRLGDLAFKGYYGIAGSVIRLAGGIALVAFARPLARRLAEDQKS